MPVKTLARGTTRPSRTAFWIALVALAAALVALLRA